MRFIMIFNIQETDLCTNILFDECIEINENILMAQYETDSALEKNVSFPFLLEVIYGCWLLFIFIFIIC